MLARYMVDFLNFQKGQYSNLISGSDFAQEPDSFAAWDEIEYHGD